MAHGFGGERVFRLDAFAERFARKEIAVLVFDYRGFGESTGEPRRLVDPQRHLEDWQAAVFFGKSLREIDSSRIALWGTSFSGGHVLVTASRMAGIRAVVAQVPFVDSLATTGTFKASFIFQALAHGLRDQLAALTLGKAHEVPVAGRPGEFALMNTPDAMDGIQKMVPAGIPWENRAPARIVLKLPFYRPIRSASKIRCPVLIVAAEKDTLIPIRAVVRTAARIPDCELVRRPVSHFDVYAGEEFERVAAIEADFLERRLRA